MKPPLRPINETRRVETLRAYRVLDTPAEPAFDDLAALAAHICEAPISTITFIDDERQWFKSNVGLAGTQDRRDISFCAHAIVEPGLFIVPDAALDPRFADNPLVTGDPKIRFYAGAPLTAPNGDVLGTLCVIDRVPRQLTPAQEEALRVLGRQVMAHLELHRQARILAESEDQLFAVLRSCPVGITVHRGKDGTFVEANAAFSALFGYSREEAIGHTVDELNIVEADALERLRSQAKTRAPLDYSEAAVKTRTGELRYVLLGVARIVLRGEPHSIISFVDITERKQAEESVRANNERFQIVSRATNDAVWDWNLTTDALWWNDAYELLFGYPPEETDPTITSWTAFIHPEDLDRVVQGVHEVIDHGGTSWSDEYRFRRQDGSYADIYDRGHIMRDAQGAPVRMIGAMQDISARKQAEAESRLLTERITLATEAAAIGIWDWDLPTDRWYATDQYSTMLGYNPATDLADRDFWLQRIHPDDVASVRETIQKVLSGDASHYEYEARIQHADGGYRWINVVGRVLAWDANGKPSRLLGVRMDISDRKHAEDRRGALEARYRALFEYAPDGIVIADPESTYLDANASMCKMLGYTRAEFIGLHASDIVVESEFSHIAQALEVIRSSADYEREWQFRRKDGSIFAAEVMATRMPDGNLMGVIRDITDRRRAESRIEHLNRVYAVLSDTNQTIVREKNPQAMLEGACRIAVEKGRFRMAWIGLIDASNGQLQISAHAGANGRTLEILNALLCGDEPGGGCAFTSMALATGEHGVCNDIAGDARSATWRNAALEREYLAMASLPLKSGNRVIGTFNLYSSEPGFFDADEMRLLDELALDISFALDVNEGEQERLRAEMALRESDERFRQLAENIREVFWITDVAKSQLIYISPAYETIWGRSSKVLYESPRNWLEGVHPDDRERIQFASDTKQAGGTFDETYRIVRPDGTERWVHDRAFPVRDEDGTVRRVVGTAEDITERLHLEEQFRQSHKMEAIGQLAGGVAHDFNNILAAIMMQADLATVTNPPAETHELLNDIKAATERAASLTRQLLAFSRRQVLQSRQLDLNDIVTSLTKMVQRILGEDVRLQLNLASHPLFTHADAGMLDQVLLNLIVNSRDAMPGGGQLTIETKDRILTAEEAATIPDATAGHYVCLRVTDTGSGISPELVPRIFEPFYTTKEPGKGTGLGLATVFGIVKQHGACLTVESTLGAGTTFEVYFRADNAGEIASAAGGPPAPKGGTETILLVEDEAAVRRVTRIVLERRGYKVLEAANGIEALKLWEQHHATIRLLFTDMVMPEGMSGRELAGILRERDPKLRVIFTSGYSADIAGRELSLREGQNFISKPSTTQQLLETVRRSLDA